MAALPSLSPSGLIQQALRLGRMAVWAESPVQQVVVNLVIIVAAMLSSAVGFLPGLVIAFIAGVLLTIGIMRAIIGGLMEVA